MSNKECAGVLKELASQYEESDLEQCRARAEACRAGARALALESFLIDSYCVQEQKKRARKKAQ